MALQYFTKEGKRIIGTFETIPGCATVTYWVRSESGEVVPVYDNETDVWWDGQQTETDSGDESIIGVDESLDTIRLSECELREVDE
jgi:hypothetical protein